MIFLIGHGYVGTEIAKKFEKFVWLNHNYFLSNDVLNLSNGNSIVINAAGYVGFPNVDACEDNKSDCISGNVLWPFLLEEICGKIPVIHIGSGCIYDGNKYFTENDNPNFKGSFYSECKALSEKVLGKFLYKSYILRIRMPFSGYNHQRNLLTKLSNYEKLIDVQNSLSCLEDVADVVKFFVYNRPKPGIYNCTNPGVIKTHEITNLLGIRPKWFENYDEFSKTVKARRSNCLLNTEKLESIYKIRPIEDAITDAIRRIKNE